MYNGQTLFRRRSFIYKVKPLLAGAVGIPTPMTDFRIATTMIMEDSTGLSVFILAGSLTCTGRMSGT